jgi:hypothetical protein
VITLFNPIGSGLCRPCDLCGLSRGLVPFCMHSPLEFVRKVFCDNSPTLVAQAVVVHVTFVACRKGLCRCALTHRTKTEVRRIRGIVGEGSTPALTYAMSIVGVAIVCGTGLCRPCDLCSLPRGPVLSRCRATGMRRPPSLCVPVASYAFLCQPMWPRPL